ncbi:hypothetical protein F4805DRAFT_431132 [Annulohypoxylon moriforme]|nr:hypothetical protein F4805DRAFT_431132 [Annulohypoxylon moriforme]
MALKFEKMWQFAADDFLNKTGKSIRKNPPTTLQDCIAINAPALQEVRTRLTQIIDAKPRFCNFLECECCGRAWDFDNPIYVCKYCHDAEFCEECLGEAEAGRKVLYVLHNCVRRDARLALPPQAREEGVAGVPPGERGGGWTT